MFIDSKHKETNDINREENLFSESVMQIAKVHLGCQ